MRFTFLNLEKTSRMAAEFAKSLENLPVSKENPKAIVVGLYGELGSGKTSFMQVVGKTMGVTENMISPTFVIEKIYKIVNHPRFSHLIHIDAYRLEKADEMLHLGWQEILNNPMNLICVEWPEKISEIMPPDHIKINFTFIDANSREIEFENYEIENVE